MKIGSLAASRSGLPEIIIINSNYRHSFPKLHSV